MKFASTVFFTLVLFATLSLSLTSIENLFDINIKGNTYYRLFILLAVIFNTSYFLTQFPKDYDDDNYGQPKGPKVLGQYTMIPVLIIYLIIFYAYIVEVIGTT